MRCIQIYSTFFARCCRRGSRSGGRNCLDKFSSSDLLCLQRSHRTSLTAPRQHIDPIECAINEAEWAATRTEHAIHVWTVRWAIPWPWLARSTVRAAMFRRRHHCHFSFDSAFRIAFVPHQTIHSLWHIYVHRAHASLGLRPFGTLATPATHAIHAIYIWFECFLRFSIYSSWKYCAADRWVYVYVPKFPGRFLSRSLHDIFSCVRYIY